MGSFKKYMELVRFSHTIFALPFALAAMFVAASGLPTLWQVLCILVCMVSARNCAMAFNRLVDRDIDAKNPRTEKRHLVSGELGVDGVRMFIFANAIIFVLGAYGLNPLAFYLSVPTLIALMAYSYFKRFSWLCHLYLGFSIGISPLGAWVGLRGDVSWFPFMLGVILMLWIAGFDIIYAIQDEKVDRELKLHSAIVKFGVDGSLMLARILHALMFAILIGIQFAFDMGLAWQINIGFILCILLYIHLFRKSNSLDSMNKDFFLANSLISCSVFVALLAQVFVEGVVI